MCEWLAGFLGHGFGQVVQLGLNQTAKCLDASDALGKRCGSPGRLCMASLLRFDGHSRAIVNAKLGDEFFGGRVVNV